MSKDIKPDSFPNYKQTKDYVYPEHLKDPRNYNTIQRSLLETLICPKSHSDPSEMFNCKTCSENVLKRRQLMKKLGFTSPEHYLEWKKRHEGIKKRMPLDMYNKMVNKE